jgi:hypothetical protein
VIVGQKIEGQHIMTMAGFDGWPNGADVIAEMGRAGRGDAGQYMQFAAHGCGALGA